MIARAGALFGSLLCAAGVYAYAFSAEPAVGALKGRVIVADTGRPLAGIRVYARPKKPKNGEDTFATRTAKDGTFMLARLPAGQYDLETVTKAHQDKGLPATITEGQVASASLLLQPVDPFLDLNVHQHVYAPNEDPRVGLHGFRQGETVRMRLLAVDGLSLVRDYGSDLRRLLDPVSHSDTVGTLPALKRGRLRVVREWSHPVEKVDAEGTFYDFLKVGVAPPGVYLLSAQGGRTEALGWLMVTDLAMVTKTAGTGITAFTADLMSGKAVPGVPVRFFASSKLVAQATTDSRGVATATVRPGDSDLSAVAAHGTSLAFMRLYGVGSGEPEKYRVFTYTDRPVYRPGHLVRFKGIVRRPQGIGYALPSAQAVYVSVKDPQDTEIWSGESFLNAHGSFDGEFALPSEVAAGYYTLQSRVGGETHTDGFSVSSYRKPEWKVDVKAEKPHYVRGEDVAVTISAEYYYGAPVMDGKVHYTVYRSPRYHGWYEEYEPEEDDVEESSGPYGDVVAEGDLHTGSDGGARFTFPTRGEKDDDPGTDYDYHVEAQVADLSDRMASGSGSVSVSRGELSVDARPEHYVSEPGLPATVAVRVLDLDDKPAAGVKLEAKATLQRWTRGKSEERLLDTQTVTTDASGQARMTATPDATGELVVRFATKDRRGNAIETTGSVWVTTAEGGEDLPGQTGLSVLPDKKLYKVGDTAQVLVRTDRPGATALVSLEAEKILDLRVVQLDKPSQVLRFPIRAGCEPNVFIHACFVRKKELVSSEARLNVSAEGHRLKVTIESDQPRYHPRDRATYRIRTTDSSGKPVSAECSFGLVDESIYAIQEEPKDALWKAFYPRRWNAVQTEYSFPTIYLGDANKEGASEAVRRLFPDTAKWVSVLRTDATGSATVSVDLPDSLTSWRATVNAVSDRTEVGRATQNVEVWRELTVRLQLPRTFTEGDHLTLTAVAHNYSPSPLDVDVRLQANGITLRSAASQKVHLKPQAAERLEWEADATAPGKATVTVLATGGAYSDGMELVVPVRPFVRESVTYRAGAVTGDSVIEDVPADSSAADGEMEIRLAPSLAGTLLGGLEYLATYPYGCTEQTMSSFLPDVAIGQTLKSLQVHRPAVEQKLPAMVQAGLLRLYRYQHPDGGWGWWENDETDPWMTGYVLYGLQVARQAGYAVNDAVYQNALNRAGELAKEHAGSKLGTDDWMLLAYALVRAKSSQAARPLLDRLPKQAKNLKLRSVGYGLLALAGTGNPDDRERAKSLMRDLWERATTDDAGTRWHEVRKKDEWYGVPADVESTAVLLQAALELTPENPQLAGVARWLAGQRHGNKWESTRDTAWILMAMADYLQNSGELHPDYRYEVVLNGKTLRTGEIRPEDALEAEAVLTVPFRELQAANRLEIRKEGQGTVYYTVLARGQVRAPAFAAESGVPGFTLQRQYTAMRPHKTPDGRIVVSADGQPATTFHVGDRVQVRLKIHADHPLEYLMLEDPLPAGFEVLERGDVPRDEWTYWWAHADFRDDRASFFIRRLEPGDHVIEYYLRPEMLGRSRVLPAVIGDMYTPSVRASTADAKLEVRR